MLHTPAAGPGAATSRGRVLSVDLLRGLDVILMLFVNEMAGVSGTPAFLLHAPAGADGMTLTDVVFPAFLFITGMSIPLAIDRRLERGQPRPDVWAHVVTRTLALVVMGVFMVNAEQGIRPGVLSPAVWNVVMTLAVFAVWSEGERARSGRTRRIRQGVGVAALVVLALLYRSSDMTGAIQFTPRWWGILGLIGWAYLVAAGSYLLVGRSAAALAGLVALLYCLYLADAAGSTTWLVAIRPYLAVGSVLGSHAAVVLSGALLMVLLREHDAAGRRRSRFVWPALAYAAVLAAAGLLLHRVRDVHQAFWISKVLATPPWCLLSSALTCGAWILVFAMADGRGWTRWPDAVRVAGQNALVAYLLAPLLLSVFALSAAAFEGVNPYAALGAPTGIGTIRSVLFVWGVVRLSGWLRGRGLALRL